MRSGETCSSPVEAPMRDYHFYVYIMASRSRTLYIGFTAELMARVWQHKNDVFDGFSKKISMPSSCVL
jgi:putative endonuclease